jgi:hypothetical protein
VSLAATIVVKGDPALLREFSRHLRPLLEEEAAGSCRERHTEAQLEYEFRLRGGIPFPPFVESSQSFPDLVIEVEWAETAQGRGGRAVIQNGVLREQAAQAQASSADTLLDVRADADGTLRLAVVCAHRHGAWLGYAIGAAQHAFFRVEGEAGSCTLSASDGVEAEWAERWTVKAGATDYAELAAREAIAEEELRELDCLAQDFTRGWIWFSESPPEETAVERQRFAAYGFPVRAANLRSEVLRKVLQPENGGLAFSSFGEDMRWIAELLRSGWMTA